jgi:hypothetical protein
LPGQTQAIQEYHYRIRALTAELIKARRK